MTLGERIVEDMKTALKAGDKTRLETLRTLRAQIVELSKRGSDKPLTPDDESAVLRSAIKKRKEAIEVYARAGRRELADKETLELEIIQGYLPQQLNPGEAEKEIEKILAAVSATSSKDFGKAMGAVMKELKGKADGALVREIVKRQLGL